MERHMNFDLGDIDPATRTTGTAKANLRRDGDEFLSFG
jgi:hypothetical protein